MSRPKLLWRTLICAVVAMWLVPATSAAHGLTGDQDPHRPLIDYLWLGFKHMAGGWDHLLFIAGVVLLAGSVRSAAKLISMFVLGHSLTLLVATLAGWQLNPTLVDVVIALSLVYVGVQGLRGRPEDLRVMGAVVFAFGLVHGLGLSTRLQDLGLPEGGLVERVLLFNVGVEIGQLVALGVIFGVGSLIVRQLRNPAGVARYGFAGLALCGVVAAVLLSAADSDEEESKRAEAKPTAAAKPTASRACTEEPSQPPPAVGGGHVEKNFYSPGETAPTADLNHVIGDGYIIVRYDATIGAESLQKLERWVASTKKGVVAAPITGQQAAVTAQTRELRLTCKGFDLNALALFQERWFDRIGVT